MAIPSSLLNLFTSFIPGFRLIDGGQLKTLADLTLSAVTGITAGTTSTQAGATQLTAQMNVVTTAGGGNTDAVKLPTAVPGEEVWLENRTANTIVVFGQAKNPLTGVGDTIIAHGTITPAATGTGITQATTLIATYKCATAGVWKQSSGA